MSVKIIAEAGSNHNGDINLAYKLVDTASQSGADFVKFQIINPNTLYVPHYWEGNNKIENLVYERRRTEMLSYEEWEEVHAYSKKRNIEFTASVFDIEGIDFLKSLKVPFIKLASSDLNNKQLIQYISKSGIPLIISTGMASLKEVEASAKVFSEFNDLSNLNILHCVSVYPCKLENTMLHKIASLKKTINCDIGFSDHTLDSKAACIATSMGVSFLEKHFTIDTSMDGFDHKYASSPEEFKQYVKDIRAVEKSLNSETGLFEGEQVTKIRARRGVYLNRNIKKGELIKKEDIIAVRPANNLNPFEMDTLIGLYAGEDIRDFEPMKLYDNKLFVDKDFSWKSANNYWSEEMKEKKMLKK